MENLAYSVLMLAENTERNQSLRAALEKDHHYALRTVGMNPLQADEAIRERTPDLVLILAFTPPFTLKLWAERIAERKIPVIFLTGRQIPPTDDLLKDSHIQCFCDDGNARLQTIMLMLGVKIRLAAGNSAARQRIQENALASECARMTGSAKAPDTTRRFPPKKLIAIGASMGGVEAVSRVLEVLPAEMPGIVMVQHMPEGFTEMYAKRLDADCRLRVVQAENNQFVEEGTVYLAPGGLHMRVEAEKEGGYRIRIADGERVSGHKPSVNVLFSSVAKAAGADALGVILTGMGDDGAKGLLEMRRAGAETIGQDEATALVYGMPRVAFEIGAVCRQSPLMEVPRHMMNYANKK